METTKTNISSGNRSYLEPPRRKVPLFVVFILVTLIVIASALGVKLYQQLRESKQMNVMLEDDKKKLEGELNNMIVEYDSLKTQNDTINLKLEAEQDKIRKLLRVQAANYEKIRMYKNELQTLRQVMRSYIVQIDSLNTKNQELTAENIQVRSKLNEVQKNNQELSKQREELTSKVNLASTLIAKNIEADPLNKNSKAKDKISKITKIRVCFTIRENAVSKPGTKDVYLRLVRPDNVVLTSSADNLFEANGQQLVYSAVRQLEYENKDIDMCIFWDKDQDLIPGTYQAILYAEGSEIGNTTFALK